MALILTEGFDWTTNKDILPRRWSNYVQNQTTIFSGQGRSIGSYGAFFTNINYGTLGEFGPFGAGTTTILGVAVKCYPSLAQGYNIVNLQNIASNTSTNNIGVWYFASDNTIRVYKSHANVTSTPATLLCSGTFSDYPGDGNWWFLEVKTVNDTGTSGSVIVRVNGTEICSNLACDTIPNGDTRYLKFGGSHSISGTSAYLDDLYICDGTGTTNNDFLGEISIKTLSPVSDISGTGTPSTGATRYGVIDEANYSTSDYLTSTTNIGDRDEFGLADLTETSGTIFGVNAVVISEKDDSGDRSLKVFVKPNGGSSEDISSANPLSFGSSSATNVISETNPDTSNAWTISDVNNMNMGIEVA